MMNGAFVDIVTDRERKLRYREVGLWTTTTLAGRVGEIARHDGSKIAVVDDVGKRSRTYTQLNMDVLTLVECLEKHGVVRGSVISVQLPNCYEAIVAEVAAQAIGAVLNPLLPNYRAHELEHVFATAQPSVIFSPSNYRKCDYIELIRSVTKRTQVHPLHVVVGDDTTGDLQFSTILDAGTSHENRFVSSASASSDVSELIFTSGTEAKPKAVMHTEETSNFAVAVAFRDLAVGPNQVVWMPSPVGHSTGLNYGARAALYHGRTLVLQDLWNASDAIELIRRNRASYTLSATTFLQGLVEECERTDTVLPEMTHFGCGGAPVPEDLVQRALDVQIVVLRLYGSTEALCGTWNRPSTPIKKRITTDGPALSHTEISIRDELGNVIHGEGVGELHLRGPSMSVGYFNDPERTAATYLDGDWVRSGDLAQLDDDGYLTVVGRKKDIIIRGGLNIAPREIEDILVSFPEVERAAVVGIADKRLGERSCACVVLRPGTTLDIKTMTDRLKEGGLAVYKLPEDLRILPSLPMTASGKVQKHEILRQIGLDAEYSSRVQSREEQT